MRFLHFPEGLWAKLRRRPDNRKQKGGLLFLGEAQLPAEISFKEICRRSSRQAHRRVVRAGVAELPGKSQIVQRHRQKEAAKGEPQ